MYSMTGYGKGIASDGEKTVTVELKSVNHRYLDFGIKLPKNFLFVEDAVKKAIGAAISRGHIDVFLTYDQKAGSADDFAVDEQLAAKYIAAANALAGQVMRSAIKGVFMDGSMISSDERAAQNIILREALRQPDIIVRKQAAEDPAKLEAELTKLTMDALCAALENLKVMRAREGEALKTDVKKKLDNIAASLKVITELAPDVVKAYRESMTARIAEVLDPTKIDEQRLATEVALYADHCCIDEEITRLGTHISAMRALIEADEPVGRKMDFLVQEFNREANTIGSKANDIRITNEVLAIKNEIEKLREQAANIE